MSNSFGALKISSFLITQHIIKDKLNLKKSRKTTTLTNMPLDGIILREALREIGAPASPDEIAKHLKKTFRRSNKALLREVKETLAGGKLFGYIKCRNGLYYNVEDKVNINKQNKANPKNDCPEAANDKTELNKIKSKQQKKPKRTFLNGPGSCEKGINATEDSINADHPVKKRKCDMNLSSLSAVDAVNEKLNEIIDKISKMNINDNIVNSDKQTAMMTNRCGVSETCSNQSVEDAHLCATGNSTISIRFELINSEKSEKAMNANCSETVTSNDGKENSFNCEFLFQNSMEIQPLNISQTITVTTADSNYDDVDLLHSRLNNYTLVTAPESNPSNSIEVSESDRNISNVQTYIQDEISSNEEIIVDVNICIQSQGLVADAMVVQDKSDSVKSEIVHEPPYMCSISARNVIELQELFSEELNKICLVEKEQQMDAQFSVAVSDDKAKIPTVEPEAELCTSCSNLDLRKCTLSAFQEKSNNTCLEKTAKEKSNTLLAGRIEISEDEDQNTFMPKPNTADFPKEQQLNLTVTTMAAESSINKVQNLLCLSKSVATEAHDVLNKKSNDVELVPQLEDIVALPSTSTNVGSNCVASKTDDKNEEDPNSFTTDCHHALLKEETDVSLVEHNTANNTPLATNNNIRANSVATTHTSGASNNTLHSLCSDSSDEIAANITTTSTNTETRHYVPETDNIALLDAVLSGLESEQENPTGSWYMYHYLLHEILEGRDPYAIDFMESDSSEDEDL